MSTNPPDERVARMMQQVSPLPAGPSFKKPINVLLSFNDPSYHSTLFTLLQQIGQGKVYGLDQPVNFHLYFPTSAPSLSNLTYLGSGLTIPHTIQVVTDQSSPKSAPRYHKIDIAILASNDPAFFTTEAQYIGTPQQPPATNDPQKDLLHLQPGANPRTEQDLPNIPSKVLLLTSLDIASTSFTFQQESTLPYTSIQGFVLHHSTFLLSSILDKINASIHESSLTSTYPYITLPGCQNIAIQSLKQREATTSTTTTQSALQYDLTHAVLTDYPTIGRITPLTSVMRAVQPEIAHIAQFTPTLPAAHPQLSPVPGLIAKHLHMWSISSPKGTFYPACVGMQKGQKVSFVVAPIASYYGNTSILAPFKSQVG